MIDTTALTPAERQEQIMAALARETVGFSDTERAMYALQAIARVFARRNPDAAQAFGEALTHSAREEKAEPIGPNLGVVTSIDLFSGKLEIRAGALGKYIDGNPPGQDYHEVVIPIPPDILE